MLSWKGNRGNSHFSNCLKRRLHRGAVPMSPAKAEWSQPASDAIPASAAEMCRLVKHLSASKLFSALTSIS